MAIDPAVQRIAHQFGVDAALIQAVVDAEGGMGRIVKAVQCSVPSVESVDEALVITCRSACHALSDFVKAQAPMDFIEMWAKRWAPVGVANDPRDLNRAWPINVGRLWLSGEGSIPPHGRSGGSGGAIA